MRALQRNELASERHAGGLKEDLDGPAAGATTPETGTQK